MFILLLCRRADSLTAKRPSWHSLRNGKIQVAEKTVQRLLLKVRPHSGLVSKAFVHPLEVPPRSAKPVLTDPKHLCKSVAAYPSSWGGSYMMLLNINR